MIQIPLDQIFYLPLILSCLVILGLWSVYSFAAHRAYRKAKRRAHLYRCEHCRHLYLDPREVPLTRCPLCGALNEAVRQ